MNHYFKLGLAFFRASYQQEKAYPANFWIGLLHSLLNLLTGILGLAVVYGQVATLNGWSFAATLSLLGTYLTLSALRSLVFGPSFEALAGMEGEIWTGNFDFTLLKPVKTQFLVSFWRWHPFAFVDLALGLGVLGLAVTRLQSELTLIRGLAFVLALAISLIILYSFLLAFAALVFRSPGFMFGWVFDSLFQLARYPTGLYPGWLKLLLTWIVPVGLITTVPAEALTGGLEAWALGGSALLACVVLPGASYLFKRGIRHYRSASS